MNILDEILHSKRGEVDARKRALPLEEVRDRGLACPRPPPLARALREAPMGLIAEIKRRSPSKGHIRLDLVPGRLAREYGAAGAHGLSVLMDAKYFGGGEEDFLAARAAVALPMLYKEFVIDPWQIWHARSLGASAVLLIVAALERRRLADLLALAEKAGVEALVEVHNEGEMRTAAAVGASLVGINNRDLKTFRVSLETTLALKDLAPDGAVLISESGIRSSADVRVLKENGVHGVLVGEHLLAQADVGAGIRDLMGEVWASS